MDVMNNDLDMVKRGYFHEAVSRITTNPRIMYAPGEATKNDWCLRD